MRADIKKELIKKWKKPLISKIKLEPCEKLYFNHGIDTIWIEEASQAGKDAEMCDLCWWWKSEVL